MIKFAVQTVKNLQFENTSDSNPNRQKNGPISKDPFVVYLTASRQIVSLCIQAPLRGIRLYQAIFFGGHNRLQSDATVNSTPANRVRKANSLSNTLSIKKV